MYVDFISKWFFHCSSIFYHYLLSLCFFVVWWLVFKQGAWGSLSPPFQPEHASWAVPPSTTSSMGNGSGGGVVPTMKKAWCHVELGWLQSLRAKLKQRDEQCYLLQRALQHKDSQTEKIVTGQSQTVIRIQRNLNNMLYFLHLPTHHRSRLLTPVL